jgi:hypothetical protein
MTDLTGHFAFERGCGGTDGVGCRLLGGVLCGPPGGITSAEEDVARIGFSVAAPQHVEVAARRHPTCWGVDARDWIRATASERAFCTRGA